MIVKQKKTANPYKQGLKRPELRIVKRILTVLSEGGSMRKTNLALKSNLSHRNCTLYLEWLDLLDLIKLESNVGDRVFSINARGRDLYLQKFCNQAICVKPNASMTDPKQIMSL